MIIMYVTAFLFAVGFLVAFLMYKEERLEHSKRSFEEVQSKFQLGLKRSYARQTRRLRGRLARGQKRNRN